MTPNEFATLVRLVKQDEGYRATPYTDTVGRLTIGWGRNLTDVGISQEEAEVLLEHDLTRAIVDLVRVHPQVSVLDPVRQMVLADMTFNLGVNGVSQFHGMWDAIDRSDWAAAAAAMLDSTWARQVKDRATRLAEAMRTGTL